MGPQGDVEPSGDVTLFVSHLPGCHGTIPQTPPSLVTDDTAPLCSILSARCCKRVEASDTVSDGSRETTAVAAREASFLL